MKQVVTAAPFGASVHAVHGGADGAHVHGPAPPPRRLFLPTQNPSGVCVPLEGSNDTGWSTVDAVGALPESGQRATADWNLSFAPGAVLSNVTLEVRASGQNGMTIPEPQLVIDGLGTSLLDWRGLGTLGEADGFTTGSTYSGRLNPNSDSGAGWDLPSDAEITQMVIEALAPRRPAGFPHAVRFQPSASAVNPSNGVLYVATNNELVLLHANNNPHIIDVYDFRSEGGVLDMVMDTNGGLLHLLLADGTFRAVSLSDSSSQPALGDGSVDRFVMAGNGDVFAANGLGVLMWDGTAWTTVASISSTDGGTEALSMIEVAGVVYAAIEGVGVLRYDTATSSALSTWSSANTLHSDSITHMAVSGNQLLLGSSDNGLARFDYVAGFWLYVDLSQLAIERHRDRGRRRRPYIALSSPERTCTPTTPPTACSARPTPATLGLANLGASLTVWPASGGASPAHDALLVDDGSGNLIHLSPNQSPFIEGELLLASAPATDEMTGLVEVDNVLYIGSADDSMLLMRYDVSNSVWLTPWTVTDNVLGVVAAPTSQGTSTLLLTYEESPVVEEMDTSGNSLQTYDGTNGCYPSTPTFSARPPTWATSFSPWTAACSSTLTVQPVPAPPTTPPTGSQPRSLATSLSLIQWPTWPPRTRACCDTTSPTIPRLEPWGSTGINGVEFAAVAMVGDVLHLGLQRLRRRAKRPQHQRNPLTDNAAIVVAFSHRTKSMRSNRTAPTCTSAPNKVLESGTAARRPRSVGADRRGKPGRVGSLISKSMEATSMPAPTLAFASTTWQA